ncbi:hypothetical protein KM043_000106 [Ampulex compressa]|nr:hypothetical protein KM043_000106 [Ampulex compressa]
MEAERPVISQPLNQLLEAYINRAQDHQRIRPQTAERSVSEIAEGGEDHQSRKNRILAKVQGRNAVREDDDRVEQAEEKETQESEKPQPSTSRAESQPGIGAILIKGPQRGNKKFGTREAAKESQNLRETALRDFVPVPVNSVDSTAASEEVPWKFYAACPNFGAGGQCSQEDAMIYRRLKVPRPP